MTRVLSAFPVLSDERSMSQGRARTEAFSRSDTPPDLYDESFSSLLRAFDGAFSSNPLSFTSNDVRRSNGWDIWASPSLFPGSPSSPLIISPSFLSVGVNQNGSSSHVSHPSQILGRTAWSQSPSVNPTHAHSSSTSKSYESSHHNGGLAGLALSPSSSSVNLSTPPLSPSFPSSPSPFLPASAFFSPRPTGYTTPSPVPVSFAPPSPIPFSPASPLTTSSSTSQHNNHASSNRVNFASPLSVESLNRGVSPAFVAGHPCPDASLIVMSRHADFGFVDSHDSQVEERWVEVHNGSGRTVLIREATLVPAMRHFSLSDAEGRPVEWIKMIPGTTVRLRVCLLPYIAHHNTQIDNGVYRLVVAVRLEMVLFGGERYRWTLDARVIAKVTNILDMKQLSAETPPFFPHWLRVLFDSAPSRIVAAVPPPLPRYLARSMSPDEFALPDAFRTVKPDQVTEEPGQLTRENYVRFWSTLLFMEEAQMNADIKTYDLFYAAIDPLGNGGDKGGLGQQLYAIQVAGLMEKRPAVLYGDLVRVRPAKHPSALESGVEPVEFIGYVYGVDELKSRILVRFTDGYDKWSKRLKRLKYKDGFFPKANKRYHVRFTFNRTALRRMHEAIRVCTSSKFPLFPAEDLLPPLHLEKDRTANSEQGEGDEESEESVRLRLFDKRINREQLQAVMRVAVRPYCGLPFIIHGPVGTGKTATVIECIMQVLLRSSSSRVLACAPSNAAADIIASRLRTHLYKNELFRLNSYQRKVASVKVDVINLCHYDSEAGVLDVPDMTQLLSYRVIVSTCASAGILYGLGVQRGQFSHIFIDESAQSLEPESLIPLMLAEPAITRVVLAGDHHQLGPSVRSPLALKFGLQKSLQERLINTRPYLRGDPRCIITLQKNYRAHPKLLELPSRLFYKNKLESHADRRETDSLIGWRELPSRHPMLFYGIVGDDMCDADSPSFFNPIEASKTVELVEKLLMYSEGRVTTNDIGVITPYRKQVVKLRMLLRARNLSSVRVGSVDDYQGQEERVIFISTVLSRKDRIAQGERQRLGFMRNPKHFNVAITRAKALLVVVGNPFVLLEDPNWAALVRFTALHGAYRGCPCPVAPDPLDDIDNAAQHMAEMSMLGWGDSEVVYPALEDLSAAFRDELDWRVMM